MKMKLAIVVALSHNAQLLLLDEATSGLDPIVRDEILDMESLAARLLELLMELYPNAINSRYKTDIRPEEHLPGHELLERVGRKRGMLVSGGEVNTERAAITVLDEYRGGKLGRITLERP